MSLSVWQWNPEAAPGGSGRGRQCTLCDTLLAEKRLGEETDAGPSEPVLDGFAKSELERLESATSRLAGGAASLEPLDALFRATLRQLWGETIPA